jgi:hypothetical protein
MKDRMRSRMRRRQAIRDEIATIVARQAGQRPHRTSKPTLKKRGL